MSWDTGGAGTEGERTRPVPIRYAVLGVVRKRPEEDPEVADTYAELAGLVASTGGVVVRTFLQVRDKPDPRTYVGRGFAEQVVRALADAGRADAAPGLRFDASEAKDNLPQAPVDAVEDEPAVDAVLLAQEVPPRTLAALSDLFPYPVLDRTGLILRIFAERARSAEGRLEVELAEALYRLPRLRGSYGRLGRQQGGVGVRGGAGETALELDRRRIRERIRAIRAALQEVRAERSRRRAERGSLPRVSLVGYTNAGKTTLLAALSGHLAPGLPRLFDTLDPTTRRVWLEGAGEVLITDTVGFVRDLPAGLLDAFAATLEEVTASDVLVHVVHGASDKAPGQYAAVRQVLERLGAAHLPELVVFTHGVDAAARLGWAPEAASETVTVDSVHGAGLDTLRAALARMVAASREEVDVTLAPDAWRWVEFARRHGSAQVERGADGTLHLTARLAPHDAAVLRRAAKSGDGRGGV